MTIEYHEPYEALTPEALDFHRAMASLREEIEAVDWYHQRVVVAADAELREILIHNRDEEIEHAAMVLEWLRRKMPGWEEPLRTYLFSEGSLTEMEQHTTQGNPKSEETVAHSDSPSSGDLQIRTL